MIRAAQPTDVERIHELIIELAVYERLREKAVGTPDLLAQHLFGERKFVESLVVEEDSTLVGYALFFTSYSSFLTMPGYWLEDIYVQPASRGKGYGRALIQEISRLAVSNGMQRVDWTVLDWNRPSIEFYESIGALPLVDWQIYRLEGAALNRIAAGDVLLARPSVDLETS